MIKDIHLLGATGSIGMQTLDIIRTNPDKFNLASFAYGNNFDVAVQIIKTFKPSFVSTRCSEQSKKLQDLFPNLEISVGLAGLKDVATFEGSNKDALLVNGLMGGVGLSPTLAAIKMGRDVALANKETLVIAGDLVMMAAKANNVRLLPVDSEHSALWQCLGGEDISQVNKLILTASGGSFRDLDRSQLARVTKKEALNHPNWSMGEKITIDSATMMNKGLEVIEAHYLFDMPYEKIETILHPQSIVHSMVEFVDSNVMANLGTADMRKPIAYAMHYPDRQPLHGASLLDLARVGQLDFLEMDMDRYPALALAYEAGRAGKTYPLALNAANEAAVELFLQEKISFLQIEDIVKEALDNHAPVQDAGLEEILAMHDDIYHHIMNQYGN